MDDNYSGSICYCRKCNGIIHTIKRGDSLYLLSRYYNVPIGEIMNANRHLNIYNLQVGEEICIPMSRIEMENDNQGMMPREMQNSKTDAGRVTVMDTESSDSGESDLDPDLKMSEILNRDDMTWGKFVSMIRNS